MESAAARSRRASQRKGSARASMAAPKHKRRDSSRRRRPDRGRADDHAAARRQHGVEGQDGRALLRWHERVEVSLPHRGDSREQDPHDEQNQNRPERRHEADHREDRRARRPARQEDGCAGGTRDRHRGRGPRRSALRRRWRPPVPRRRRPARRRRARADTAAWHRTHRCRLRRKGAASMIHRTGGFARPCSNDARPALPPRGLPAAAGVNPTSLIHTRAQRNVRARTITRMT